MKASPACTALIKQFEGLRTEAYLCPAGIPTIGFGHTQGVELGQSIDAEEADRLLVHDVEQSEAAVSAAVRVPLTQGQFDALVSFTFNFGAATLHKSSLLHLLNAGNFRDASAEFPKWCHTGQTVLPGLVRRRTAELQLFLS